ncbi:ATP-binding protein [Sphaerochaeta globosa]|uniref:ATPase n=1 Tax=Sphaerochaeta globosa (strain ATCC BAA-1886 / DSM 22777 / Buddy) TaxID=158189 RepID=F0RXE6_SPHGB|nr:ATP-binding protein [Sphaerochaeta globosa]ADY11996.1 hypothetical protein SpiBuddy_0154 [Sphaerochaeta globosa str. Buddy]
MVIERTRYLNMLINKRKNGRVKIVTGIRRCGKSFLLFELYHKYLLSEGVSEQEIIELQLDDITNAKYQNPFELDAYIRELISDVNRFYYVFIDEIQRVYTVQNPYVDVPDAKIGFVDVVLGLLKLKHVDLYISGSNSKMLSSDIHTDFKDRGTEIKVNPLTYQEFHTAFQGDERYAWDEYVTYGGMPYAVLLEDHEEKSHYLKDLFEKTYLSDVKERYKIGNDISVLDALLDYSASAVGSLTNAYKLSNTFRSVTQTSIKPETISRYLEYFQDAYILRKALRYDVKGRKYIGTPYKYYFTDVGLRNARLNFRQSEENHIMENIIYNELIVRGYDVDVGVVETSITTDEGKKIRTQHEIDFVASKGSQRYYLQSAFSLATEEKRQQEILSLIRVPDSFRKIVIIKDRIVPKHDDQGILYLGIEQFLLEEASMDL